MLGYLTFKCSQNAGRSCDEKAMLGYVTHSSPDVVKRAKRWNTIGPSQNRQPFNYVGDKCNEIVFSMCSVQCGSMEAKPLSLFFP